jgi:quercetin dioxygenase-like cupin family protein
VRLGGEWEAMASGVERRLSALGEKLMGVEVRLAGGSAVPEHSHPHEQVTIVLSGRVRFTIAGEAREFAAGEVASIPGGVPHSVVALEASRVMDVFTPLREDLLG